MPVPGHRDSGAAAGVASASPSCTPVAGTPWAALSRIRISHLNSGVSFLKRETASRRRPSHEGDEHFEREGPRGFIPRAEATRGRSSRAVPRPCSGMVLAPRRTTMTASRFLEERSSSGPGENRASPVRFTACIGCMALRGKGPRTITRRGESERRRIRPASAGSAQGNERGGMTCQEETEQARAAPARGPAEDWDLAAATRRQRRRARPGRGDGGAASGEAAGPVAGGAAAEAGEAAAVGDAGEAEVPVGVAVGEGKPTRISRVSAGRSRRPGLPASRDDEA